MIHKFWTPEEDVLLIKLFAYRVRPEDMVKQFPDHTQHSIENRLNLLKKKIRNEPTHTGGYILRPEPGVIIHRVLLD